MLPQLHSFEDEEYFEIYVAYSITFISYPFFYIKHRNNTCAYNILKWISEMLTFIWNVKR